MRKKHGHPWLRKQVLWVTRMKHKELSRGMAMLHVLIGALATVVHAFIKNTSSCTLKMDALPCV